MNWSVGQLAQSTSGVCTVSVTKEGAGPKRHFVPVGGRLIVGVREYVLTSVQFSGLTQEKGSGVPRSRDSRVSGEKFRK